VRAALCNAKKTAPRHARQIYTAALSVTLISGVLFLIHFDAVRVRVLRRAPVQLCLGFLAIVNSVRVLLRERLAGS
jgi:hypothetical protein